MMYTDTKKHRRLSQGSGQVRNRNMSKRETEKLIKEVWKEKLVDNQANKGGTQTELGDFLFTFLQKKVGIQTAVIEVRPMPACVEQRGCMAATQLAPHAASDRAAALIRMSGCCGHRAAYRAHVHLPAARDMVCCDGPLHAKKACLQVHSCSALC